MDLDISSIASRTSASRALAYPHFFYGRNAVRAPVPVCIPRHYSSASGMNFLFSFLNKNYQIHFSKIFVNSKLYLIYVHGREKKIDPILLLLDIVLENQIRCYSSCN